MLCIHDGSPDPHPRLFLHSRYPHCGSRGAGQQEEEAQDGNELQNHGDGTEPEILPAPELQFPPSVFFVEPSELEPSVVRQFAEPGTCDHDEGRGADVGDEVEREEDD